MTTNLAGVRKPAHWYAMLPGEQLEWAINEISALTDQLQHAKNTINVLVSQRDQVDRVLDQRKTDDGTQIMSPELHRPWDFRPPQDQEEFYCAIGTPAGRTYKRTMCEAIEHARSMFKRNDGTKKLLVVRVERVLEQAAPPIVERAPVAGDFPR